jgi:hypothetical protein
MGDFDMTLSDVIARLNEFDDDQTIYVTKNAPDAEAEVNFPPDDGSMNSANGVHYLLEVFLAKEAIQVWSEWRAGRLPMLDEKIQAVVYYAENDAYMPAE